MYRISWWWTSFFPIDYFEISVFLKMRESVTVLLIGDKGGTFCTYTCIVSFVMRFGKSFFRCGMTQRFMYRMNTQLKHTVNLVWPETSATLKWVVDGLDILNTKWPESDVYSVSFPRPFSIAILVHGAEPVSFFGGLRIIGLLLVKFFKNRRKYCSI